MSIDKTLEDLEGDTQQRDGSMALWIPWGPIYLKETTSALLQILGILRLRNQKNRNSYNFISEPAWSANSGQMESGPAAFPGEKL